MLQVPIILLSNNHIYYTFQKEPKIKNILFLKHVKVIFIIFSCVRSANKLMKNAKTFHSASLKIFSLEYDQVNGQKISVTDYIK